MSSLADTTAHQDAYRRSVLKVQLPVSTILGRTRLPLAQVLKLARGSIIDLATPCQEPLALAVAGRQIAVGEVVKVGEKFGLRITALNNPKSDR